MGVGSQGVYPTPVGNMLYMEGWSLESAQTFLLEGGWCTNPGWEGDSVEIEVVSVGPRESDSVAFRRGGRQPSLNVQP